MRPWAFTVGKSFMPRRSRYWSQEENQSVGSDGILTVRGAHKRDFVFRYFRLIAGQIDFDGPVYEVAIADVVQHGFK